jgi:hypothetical protein
MAYGNDEDMGIELDAEEIFAHYDNTSRSHLHNDARGHDRFHSNSMRFPHKADRTPGFIESAKGLLLGDNRSISTPAFKIITQRTGTVQLSLFAHHETQFLKNGLWLMYFTLAESLLALIIGFMAMLVVTGIVTSYYNGVLWVITSITAALLVVVHLGSIVLSWAKYSPYSHLYNIGVLFPAFYFAFAMLISALALGYWVSTYQDSFSGKYDPTTATTEETLYYYGTYTLVAVMCFSTLPDLVGSAVTQLYPERKVYLSDEDSGKRDLYYMSNDGSAIHADMGITD